MALFRVANERAQFDAASNDARDQYGAGIRFTQEGNARVTTSAGTFYNQGIPMSGTGQVAIVDATAGLPSGTIYHNGLPMSGDKVCVSKNATAVVSNGLPFDSAGALAADINFDLNFIGTDTLNSSVTFTRASTATYFNSAGVLTSAAINEARFDYNPATLAARGLLIEEQRTNLTTYSEDATQWGAGSNMGTTLSNQTTAPDGTLTADKIVENTANSTHFLSQTQTTTYTSGVSYTRSIFLKLAERQYASVYLPGTNFPASGRTAVFDLQTGTIVSTESGVTSSIVKYPNNWYRCVITATATSTGTGHVGGTAISDNASMTAYLGDGTSGVFIWGAQLEAGAFPTSYIPTTTTALTRSADVASVNTLSPWFNATEGTLFAEITASANANTVYAALNNGTITQNSIYFDNDSGVIRNVVFSSSSAQAAMSTGAIGTVGAVNKIAGAYAVNNFAVSRNGGSAVTDTSGAVPVSVSQLDLGRNPSGLAVTYISGYLRRITYYPRRLSNADLQAITA